MRKYLYLSAAALAFASCSSDEFVGNDPGTEVKNTGATIAFGSEALNATRAELKGSLAAEKLNNNFIVYGFKTNGAETTDGTKTNDEKVFDTYNVNFVAGTANTTESNTADWEYVGLNAHETSSITGLQSIKYWDYAANGYVFSAVSGTGIKAYKAESATASGTAYAYDDATKALTVPGTDATQYDKGWKVVIPAGGDLSTLYASDRKPITKPTSPATYGQVDLTFRALGTKIRFAMYETVPGYEIKIKNLYYDGLTTANSTNFAIDGTFKTAKSDAETPLYITYYKEPSEVENRPKVSYNDSEVASAAYGIFGANIQAADHIGTTSVEATYDQSDKSYTMILPYEGATNALNLKVDYTLTSTDGSNETIEVKGATAIVPANFNQWKPNFAYTYLFKISDNTNGYTGTVTDPAGLYPITFDAVVITDETDVQETITSVSDPSITTYQKGVVVTENDEYKAGDIYFENDAKNISDYHVYEVNNYGTEATTEEVVANWKNNFCVLTEVAVIKSTNPIADFIPLSDGTFLKKGANEAAKFTAFAGKTYVIVNNTADALDPTSAVAQCKVVKVSGTVAADPEYTQSMTIATISTAAGVAVYSLKSNSPKADANVIGATACLKIFNGAEDVTTDFVITDNVNGTYNIALTPAAIAAGANGTYTVKFNGNGDKTFTVGLSYTLSPAVIYVVTAGTGSTFALTDGTNAISDAVVKNLPDGLTIEETSTAGTYMATASKDAATGVHHVLVAGQDLAISVLSYSFSAPVLTITRKLSGDNTGTITLNENGVAKSGISLTTSPALATGTTVAESAGVYTYTVTDASEGGVYDISYENAKAQVVVNAYTITAADASIDAPTGSTTLTVTKNGKEINATVGKVLVTATIGGSNVVPTVGTQYSLTTNGSKLIFKPVVAGSYNFTYVEDGEQVALATVVAN